MHVDRAPCASRSAAVQAPELPLGGSHWSLELRLYYGEALLDIRHYRAPLAVTLGETGRSSVFVTSEELPADSFPLVRTRDEAVILTFAPVMSGEVELGGRVFALAELPGTALASRDLELPGCWQVALPLGARALVRWGGLTLALRFVSPGRPVGRAGLKQLDTRFLNALVASLVLHVTFVLSLVLTPYDAQAIRQERFVDVVITLRQQTIPPTTPVKPPEPEVAPATPDPTPAAGPTRGPPAPRRLAPGTSRATQRRQLLELFNQSLAGVASLAGSNGSFSRGLAGVIGTVSPNGAAIPLAGLGVRDLGARLGGGLGRSRDIAAVDAACVGECRRGVHLPPPGPRRPPAVLELEPPRVEDSIDRELVRQVIEANRQQIRYCYERGLERRHDLEGKVALRWIIGGTGAVARVWITESTLADAAVHACIEEKIRGWRFPAPAGGGKAEIGYGFVFRAH